MFSLLLLALRDMCRLRLQTLLPVVIFWNNKRKMTQRIHHTIQHSLLQLLYSVQQNVVPSQKIAVAIHFPIQFKYLMRKYSSLTFVEGTHWNEVFRTMRNLYILHYHSGYTLTYSGNFMAKSACLTQTGIKFNKQKHESPQNWDM